MPVVTALAPYSDDRGNRIVVDGPSDTRIKINFRGSNNQLVIATPVRLRELLVVFDCDNGVVRIERSQGAPAFSADIRIGQDSQVLIGRNVSSTTTVAMSATEGTTINVGDDVMFASENQVRADDGHPIFDVRTGLRVNVSKSIRIGPHVWIGRSATVLGGATIGSGSVIGYGAIVTGAIPNNCIAVGIPARVIRKDVAWERPHLSIVKPYYKPDASTVPKSKYWALTEEAPRKGWRYRIRHRLARSRFAPALRAVARPLRRRTP